MVVRRPHSLRGANAPCNVLAMASQPALALFIAAGKAGAKNPSGEFTVMVVIKSNGVHGGFRRIGVRHVFLLYRWPFRTASMSA